MKIEAKRFAGLAMVAATVLLVSGCATTDSGSASTAAATPAALKPVVAAKTAPMTTPNYFLVHTKEGRLWAFGDVKTYLEYRQHGEVALTRTRIGVGPQGQSVVFGVTSDDVNKKLPSMAENFFDGKVAGGNPFYGEIIKGGRYHVFGEWQDFVDYVEHGEVILTFTEIGTGPKGETVIYALNKETSKAGRPVKLIEQFKNLRGMK